jgi:hypothetical protein
VGSGHWYAGPTCLNTPTPGEEFNVLVTAGLVDRISQTATSIALGTVFTRSYTGTIWTAWKQLAAVNDLVSSVFRVGCIQTFSAGVNPNTLYPGTTWVQLEEGTFLMNTLGGDVAGGSNDAVLPQHSHTANFVGNALPNHSHQAGSGNWVGRASASTGGDVGFSDNTSRPIGNMPQTQDVSAGTPTGSVSVVGAGVPLAGGENRPKYRGVGIWERTA